MTGSSGDRLRAGSIGGIALAALLATGQPAAAEPPLAVLATVGMVGDVARAVGGACVSVETMIGPGSDPHLYRPTASDVDRLAGAELILYVGLNLEGQLGEVLGRFARRTPTLAVAEAAIPPGDRLADEDAPGMDDPHVWMDPALWARTAPVIAEAIAEARPDCAEALADRAAAYAGDLEALAGWMRESAATIPEAQRVLVTAHDAFAYFAAATGLEVVAIQGISTEAEAGIADIRAAADAVLEAGVPAVFVETTINPRTIEALVEAVAARGGAVRIGGALFSDAMGEDGTPEGSYIGMIRHNTVAIVEGLGGTPAPLPPALDAWAEVWEIE